MVTKHLSISIMSLKLSWFLILPKVKTNTNHRCQNSCCEIHKPRLILFPMNLTLRVLVTPCSTKTKTRCSQHFCLKMQLWVSKHNKILNFEFKSMHNLTMGQIQLQLMPKPKKLLKCHQRKSNRYQKRHFLTMCSNSSHHSSNSNKITDLSVRVIIAISKNVLLIVKLNTLLIKRESYHWKTITKNSIFWLKISCLRY